MKLEYILKTHTMVIAQTIVIAYNPKSTIPGALYGPCHTCSVSDFNIMGCTSQEISLNSPDVSLLSEWHQVFFKILQPDIGLSCQFTTGVNISHNLEETFPRWKCPKGLTLSQLLSKCNENLEPFSNYYRGILKNIYPWFIIMLSLFLYLNLMSAWHQVAKFQRW